MAKEKKNANLLWYFDPNLSSRNSEPKYGRAKAFLFDKLYRSITQHDLLECHKLLRLVPRETSLDPYVLFRFVLILINSVETDRVNKNFLIYLESSLAKLNLSKPDAFVEFLSYFIGNNRINDAKELLAQKQRTITNLRHRPIPFVDLNICCYKFFISYSEWKGKNQENQLVKFDYSIQGWLVNAMDSIKQVTSNYEYFALAIVEVLLHYGFFMKAYLFVSEFQRMNPDNVAAQLMLFNLINLLVQIYEDTKERKKPSIALVTEESRIKKRSLELSLINNFCLDETIEYFDVEGYPLNTDRKLILDNLKRLDKKRFEILELSVGINQIENVQVIMDSLEYIREIKNLTRWQSLKDVVHSILSSSDEQLISELRTLWQTRYQQFWDLDYFLSAAGDEFSDKDLIKNVVQLLSSKFDSSEEVFDNDLDEDGIKMELD